MKNSRPNLKHELPFEQVTLWNPTQARAVVRSLIDACGQSDREQLGVILLDGKNKIIGLNIVSTGMISSTPGRVDDRCYRATG
jgi:DNA repair protein RadC